MPCKVEDIIKNAEKQGKTVVSRSTQSEDNFVLDNGVFRIVQQETNHSGQTEEYNASIPPTRQFGPKKVVMSAKGIIPFHPQWYIQHAYGTKDGFFILPFWQDLKEGDIGSTTLNKDGYVNVDFAGAYPIWKLRVDEIVIYRNTDGSIEIHYFLRIFEIGTPNCWRTTTSNEVSVVKANDSYRAAELYEFIPYVFIDYITITESKPITVTAHNADVQKKLWFSSSALTEQDISKIISAQLTAVASNQGWASDPSQGIWTWFELAIVTEKLTTDTFTESKIKKGKDGKPLTWVSQYTQLSSVSQTLVGKLFEKDSELLKNLSAGDYVAVLACAQFAAWSIKAASAKLVFAETRQVHGSA